MRRMGDAYFIPATFWHDALMQEIQSILLLYIVTPEGPVWIGPAAMQATSLNKDFT